MSPARRQPDLAASREALKSRIAIDLNDAFEPLEMRSRTLGSTIGAVEVDGRRWIGSTPRPVIPG
jgi:hypothetical protein